MAASLSNLTARRTNVDRKTPTRFTPTLNRVSHVVRSNARSRLMWSHEPVLKTTPLIPRETSSFSFWTDDSRAIRASQRNSVLWESGDRRSTSWRFP